MTFKRSFRDNYRNRLWIVALVILTAVLQYVFIPAVHMGGARIRLSDTEILSDPLPVLLQNAGGEWFAFSTITGMLFTVVVAAIMGIQGFSYLYQTRSVDFYDSQPIAFSQRFFINYISSVVLYAVVYGAGVLASIVVVAMLGMGSAAVFTGLLGEYIWLVVLFIGMYSISVLAAVLSGNLFIAALMDAFLCGIELLYRLLNYGCMSSWYTTMYTVTDSDLITPVSLPLSWYIMRFVADIFSITAPWGNKTAKVCAIIAEGASGMLISLIIGGIATALAYNAFLHRKREMVQKGLCFGFAESAVKLALGISGGILAGLVGDSVFDSLFSYSPLTIIVMAVTVILICTVGEWILSLDITKLFRRAWQIPVCLVISAAILFVFKADMFGYDKYIPEASKVKSCAFYPQNSYSYSMIAYDQEVDWGMNRDRYFAKYMHLENTEDVEAVARLGMEAQRNNQINASEDSKYQGGWQAIVLYNLTDGSQVYRKIWLPYDTDEALMNAVLGSEDYRRDYFDVKGVCDGAEALLNSYPKSQINLMYTNRTDSEMGLVDLDTLKEIMNSYAKDIKSYDYSLTQDKICLATLDINLATRNYTSDFPGGMNQTLPIYENYTNTLEVLKSHNIYCELLPEEDKVAKVLAEYTLWNDYGEELKSNTSAYTDKDKIGRILDALELSMLGEWTKEDYDSEYFYITVLTDSDLAYAGDLDDPAAYQNQNCGVTLPELAGNAPGFLVKDLDYSKPDQKL